MRVAEKVPPFRGKRRTILIVDDHVSLATCLEMLLESHGYEVWRTADGTGGLKSIKLKDFDVILCDLVMPGLSGDALHAAVGLLKPHLCDRFIFMSGHPDKLPGGESEGRVDRPVLRKPFPVQHLLEAIESVMNNNASNSAQATAMTPATL